MAPVRVTLVIESLGRGGAERLLLTTLAGLDRLRVAPRVVRLGGSDALAREVEALDVPLHDLGMEGPGDLPRTVVRLRRLLRETDTEVLHTHLYFANQAGRLATLGSRVRLLTTLHNPDYTHEAHAGLRFAGRKGLERLTLALNPGRLMAVSEAVRADYRSHFRLPPVEVLPNYMDVAAFQARVAGADREAVRRSLGAGPDDRVVLHVGRLHPQKGHDALIRALARARERAPNLRLVLAGQGRLRQALEGLASGAGVADRVHFAGVVPDPAGLYAAADLFAFPSRYEAFGIALLEAMAAGLPAVVTRTGGIVEVATPDTARFVEVDDVDGLAGALQALADDTGARLALGAAGRERARRFDAAEHLPRLMEVYEGA